MVIGISITRGSGFYINKEGIKATTHTYGGTLIPNIRDRLPHLTGGISPEIVVLQAGGNDCQSVPLDKVKHEYSCLVNDVKYQRPEARIVLSSIPPRKGSVSTNFSIAELNEKN